MSTKPQRKPPNILLVMTDQHRYECLGCHDHPLVRTPHIDALAARGVDFQRTYAQSAICMPSRFSVFTGQYLHTHGVQGNAGSVDVSGLTLLPALLRDHGYQTAMVGKSHAGPVREIGFEHARLCAGLHRGETNHYREHLEKNGLLDKLESGEHYKSYDAYVSGVPWRHSPEYWTGDRALEFLETRDADRPFFAWVSFERPHAPTSVPSDNPFPYDPAEVVLPPADPSFYDGPDTKRPGCENMWNVFHTGPEALRQAIANYFSLITMIDHQVGRLTAALAARGELENTIVVFTADHGDFCGEYGQFGKNLTTFDVLYRVPLIFSWPGVTDREQVHELTELVDVMPTLLDLAGLPCPRTVQGETLAPAVVGSALRCGRPWEGKEAVFFENPVTKTVRTKTHKLSFCHRGNREWGQLFDLRDDPRETRNLYGDPACAWVQRELERELLRWFIRTQQPRVAGGAHALNPPWRWYRDARGGERG